MPVLCASGFRPLRLRRLPVMHGLISGLLVVAGFAVVAAAAGLVAVRLYRAGQGARPGGRG